VRNDAQQIKFFLGNVRAGDLVLDVGGHNGQYAVLFASLVSQSGKVITFEPDPNATATLRANLELNGFQDRVKIESLALFDENGEHVFFSKGADSMSSLVRSGLGANAFEPGVIEYRVKTVRLDDLLKEQVLPAPAVIKIDTEGAEINILRGAQELLKRGGTTIVCELHPYAWEEFGTTYGELLRLVADCNRSIEYLDKSLNISDGAFYGAVVIR
jgi:FkbM family methyltransferase